MQRFATRSSEKRKNGVKRLSSKHLMAGKSGGTQGNSPPEENREKDG